VQIRRNGTQKKYKNPIKKINLKEIIYKDIEGRNAA
jgi:hypothetical protein